MDGQFTLEDSLQLLANNYHKILRINLTDDSHTELKMYAHEKNKQKGYSEKISERQCREPYFPKLTAHSGWLKDKLLTGEENA